ncbi:putative ABC transporter substrate-binding protein YesO [Bacillus sp. J14TS2]|uniref:ABC transporter substrate-binding protein n=1 Tax=Bacillus sp. J14TS2 TaxID=2807188 RepID=UPI001AFE1194|nr:ABC transporter substrate-binding protein [Bacillus sp. J14TS2]GIN70733.1 putative ABC transporter substrate-binding protein YesO [Bacillus sp. J14TS2]
MKKGLVFILGMLLVFLLAACNSNENTSTDSNDQSGNNNKNSDEEVTLRIAWWGDQPRHDSTNEVIKLYQEKNPNVKVEAEYATWADYWQKLAPQAAANELPDIIQMDLSYITQYAQNNQLADLTPYLGEQIDTSNIADTVITGGKVGNGVYGFNLGVNAIGFQYDPEVLKEVGVDAIPENWTWDDYKELSKKAEGVGIYFDTGMTPDVFFNYYLRTQGKCLYAEDGSGLGYDDDQLFVDWFTMLKEQVDKGLAPTPDYSAQLTGIEDDPVVKQEGVGIWQWSNQFVGLQQVADRPMEIAPMPGPGAKDGLFLKPSMFFSVTENSKHKETAAEFIDFFINDVEANKFILAERGVPVSSEVKEALKSEVSEAQAQVFDYIEWAEENSSPMGVPDPAQAGQIIELLDSLSEQMNYGEISPEDAAKNFRQQAESILGN